MDSDLANLMPQLRWDHFWSSFFNNSMVALARYMHYVSQM